MFEPTPNMRANLQKHALIISMAISIAIHLFVGFILINGRQTDNRGHENSVSSLSVKLFSYPPSELTNKSQPGDSTPLLPLRQAETANTPKIEREVITLNSTSSPTDFKQASPIDNVQNKIVGPPPEKAILKQGEAKKVKNYTSPLAEAQGLLPGIQPIILPPAAIQLKIPVDHSSLNMFAGAASLQVEIDLSPQDKILDLRITQSPNEETLPEEFIAVIRLIFESTKYSHAIFLGQPAYSKLKYEIKVERLESAQNATIVAIEPLPMQGNIDTQQIDIPQHVPNH